LILNNSICLIEGFKYISKIHLTMDFELTRLSSKGQIVIPFEFRKGMKEGDKLIIMRSGDNILLKKASALDEQMKEDFEFARRTEEAWKAYDRGEFKEMSSEDFLKEIRSLK